MKISFREKLRYRFERYLNKGGSSIFFSLFIVFIGLFLFVIFIRWLLLMIWPEMASSDNFLDDIWNTWLQMMDPGSMGEDSSSATWIKIASILAGIFGVIILSILIAFITTALEKTLYDFRKGRGKVIERNHTLILGWNERVVDIIRELVIANESEKYAAVVILAKADKEEMDDMLAKRLTETGTTRIVTTTGDYANINELKRVNISEARSVIVLASASESSMPEEKSISDVQSIKSIMAIMACQDGKNELPVIAEIFSSEKRELIGYFNDNKIIALDSWDIMGKLLVQTALTSGLEMVYNEILSFDGCEIYFHTAQWGNVQFGELAYHFKDGIPLGVYHSNGTLKLRPENDYVLRADDRIVILAEDDSTVRFDAKALYRPEKLELSDRKLEQQQKSVLILGWHNIAEIFIREAVDYMKEGSTFDIHINKPTAYLQGRLETLRKMYPGFDIHLHDLNPLKLESLKSTNPFSYDNIIILSQDQTVQGADKIDSDTLIILLLLRKIKKTVETAVNTKIITQVLNSENQEIITQTEVDDFIISNKLITMILAQLSEQPLIKKVYDDLFSEDGSEIYVKPANLYAKAFPLALKFGDLIALAGLRREICLGIRKGSLSKDPDNNFGVMLNLPKNQSIELEEDDFLVVLSEDEL